MPESIDGTIRSVKYTGRSFDGGAFTIAKIDGNQTVMGDLEDPREGESYRFFGEWQAAKPPYKGKDFKFTSCEVIVDMSTDGVAQYLKNYIDGLGTVKASMIVEHFGAETLTVLRETPERALEVHRITREIVDSIKEHFDKQAETDPATEAKLLEMFRGQKFPRRIVKQLMRAYRGAAPERVMGNPYLLLQFRGVGWKLVDSFALTVAQYSPPGIERHMGAIKEAFETLANDGHTCSTIGEVNRIAGGLLAMPVNGEAWKRLAGLGEVVAHSRVEGDSERVVALARYANAEREVAERVVRLLEDAVPLAGELDIHGLAEEQDEAVEVIKANGLAILTGSPGSGKTWTVSKTLQSMIDSGIPASSILFVAPTGKASKRGAEVLAEHGVRGIVCSTIHKALGPTPGKADPAAHKEDAKLDQGRESFGFNHNEGNPLKASVIVIEESSMLDIRLAASLFRAIRPGTRVLIVGDENQLPSVGPGSFLRDLMVADVPSFTLREIRRSVSAGTVVHACHKIRDGIVPEPADRVDLVAHKNWVHIETEPGETETQEIADKIVNLIASVKTFDPIWGVQVVTPQKTRHPFATGSLNYRLGCLLNPVAREAAEVADASEDPESSISPPYYIGDKVIRTENGIAKEMITRESYTVAQDEGEEWAAEPFKANWTFRGVEYRLKDSPIVNGDMGTVIDILKVGGIGYQVVVALKAPDRMVRLPQGEAKLIQAYALTAHKMQGSSAPFVIVPVHHAVYAGLFTREWLYTAISRTATLLVTVGPFSAIETAIGRKTVDKRVTRLRHMLSAELAERAAARRLADVAGDVAEAGLAEGLEKLECELVGVGEGKFRALENTP